MSTSHQIAFVRPGSPAALAGVEPMDIIKEINGVELIDIFDYYYYEDEPDFRYADRKAGSGKTSCAYHKIRGRRSGDHLREWIDG